jgi:hypothetical protein
MHGALLISLSLISAVLRAQCPEGEGTFTLNSPPLTINLPFVDLKEADSCIWQAGRQPGADCSTPCLCYFNTTQGHQVVTPFLFIDSFPEHDGTLKPIRLYRYSYYVEMDTVELEKVVDFNGTIVHLKFDKTGDVIKSEIKHLSEKMHTFEANMKRGEYSALLTLTNGEPRWIFRVPKNAIVAPALEEKHHQE